MRADRRDRSRQQGLSMIEVLVAMGIATVALLGLMAMQMRSLTSQKDSFDRKAAAELLVQLAERMRANQLGYVTGQYVFDFTPGTASPTPVACADVTQCTPAELAARDLAEWQRLLVTRLPGAGAFVRNSTVPLTAGQTSVRITLVWKEAAPSESVDAACTAVGYGTVDWHCLDAEVFP